MTFFFLLLIFVFIIVPIFRAMVGIYRMRRSARQFFDRFRNQAASAEKSAAPEAQPKPRKKIDPEDGEFVAFEELPPDAPDGTERSTSKIVIDEQIVDVEWEDIN